MEKKLDKASDKSFEMGMHEEELAGRTQQVFFSSSEEENFVYPFADEVDFSKKTEFDMANMNFHDVNEKLKNLLKEGYGDITVHNPGSKHSIGTRILNRLKLRFKGSLGYFACGVIDGPTVHIEGRVGWSCGQNMMSGQVIVEKNAGSTFGAAIRGGDLVCRGSVGSRTGIDQKGGTIIVGGNCGAFTGFMMQRGRIIILGDAGINLGDTMYDGTIYVGGKIADLGVDAVEGEMNEKEIEWLKDKLVLYGMKAENGVENMTKIISGKKLWNYDSLEPNEKKLIL